VTSVRVALVDLYVIRGAGSTLEFLVLRRAAGGRCPGSWEAVHGHIEPTERPADAAIREMLEETGLRLTRLYNLSRVESFYRHRLDEVALIPVFAAFVPSGAEVRIGPEHDRYEWLTAPDARARFNWPRERRALDAIVEILSGGDAGPVEDVLRVC
jgi:dATP pyrophosphohydrolase